MNENSLLFLINSYAHVNVALCFKALTSTPHTEKELLVKSLKKVYVEMFAEKADDCQTRMFDSRVEVCVEKVYELEDASEFNVISNIFAEIIVGEPLFTQEEIFQIVLSSAGSFGMDSSIYRVLEKLNLKPKQYLQLAEAILKNGGTLLLANNFDKFKIDEREHLQLAGAILKNGEARALVNNFDKFKIDEREHLQLAEAILKNGGALVLANNFDKFKIDEREHLQLAVAILKNGGALVLANNFDKFKIDEREHLKLAGAILKNRGARALVNNFEKFKINEREYLRLAEAILKNGGALFLANNFEKFKINKEQHFQLAGAILKNGGALFLANNFEKFKINKEQHFQLAKDIIKNGGARALVNNFEKFKINKEQHFQLAKDIIEQGNILGIISLFYKFQIDEEHHLELARLFSEKEGRGALLNNITNLKISSKKILEIYIKLSLNDRFKNKVESLKHMCENATYTADKETAELEPTPEKGSSVTSTESDTSTPSSITDKKNNVFENLRKKANNNENTEIREKLIILINTFEMACSILHLNDARIQEYEGLVGKIIFNLRSPDIKEWTLLFLTNALLHVKTGPAANNPLQLVKIFLNYLNIRPFPKFNGKELKDKQDIITIIKFLKTTYEKRLNDKLNKKIFTGTVNKEMVEKIKILETLINIMPIEKFNTFLDSESKFTKDVSTAGSASTESCFSIEALKKQLENLVKESFGFQDVDNFTDKYIQNIAKKFRDPYIHFTYLGTLNSSSKNEVILAKKALKKFIQDIITETFEENRYSNEMAPCYHVALKFNPNFAKKWRAGSTLMLQNSYKVEDTIDPYTLLAQGTHIEGSCQKVTRTPTLCCGLAKRLVSGDIRLLVVRNSEGKMVGRAVLRLMLNQNKEPIVFVEKFYVNNNNEITRDDLKKMLLERAKEWKIPVYEEGNSGEETALGVSNGYPDYVDANRKGICVEDYSISNLKAVEVPGVTQSGGD